MDAPSSLRRRVERLEGDAGHAVVRRLSRRLSARSGAPVEWLEKRAVAIESEMEQLQADGLTATEAHDLQLRNISERTGISVDELRERLALLWRPPESDPTLAPSERSGPS